MAAVVARFLIPSLTLTLLVAPVRADDAATAPEYGVKAAFLYNFTKFVEWPDEAAQTAIRLCVLGKDPFGELLDSVVTDKTVRGKELLVKRVQRLEQARRCHVLFLGHAERRHLDAAVRSLRSSNVLIVSEAETFGEPGGMIKLVIEDNKVRIEIHVGNTRAAGLEVSSRLLGLARVTGDDVPGSAAP